MTLRSGARVVRRSRQEEIQQRREAIRRREERQRDQQLRQNLPVPSRRTTETS